MRKNTTLSTSLTIAFLLLTSIFSTLNNAQAQSVIISEFMASNETTLSDEDGDFPDWIELQNLTSQNINLLGWRITDNASRPNKWILPAVTIEANGYLILFASGKDRNDPGSELHTNFSLSREGEYLGLFNSIGVLQNAYSPTYPLQFEDISYGIYQGTHTFFNVPTPRSSNETSEGVLLHAPSFSVNHGFFEEPFQLTITANSTLGSIYYTTDGSVPKLENGTLYTEPLNIASTKVLRAASLLSDQITGMVHTRTYLFLDDIIHQSNNQPGYPDNWGKFTAISGNAPAYYAMNAELISNPSFADAVKEGIMDLPVISLVTDKEHLFSHDTDPDKGGIYIHTGAPVGTITYGIGRGWERPMSFEYFNADGSISIQENCGVLLQGGHGRRPEKSPKHSFRIIFRNRYGASRWNYPIFGSEATSSFKALNIRAGFGNSWIHQEANQRRVAQYQRDSWGKDTQGAMGHIHVHAVYAHLFINGMYWGMYNPSERLDRRFAASYLGGEEDDFDVIKDYTEAQDGNLDAWNRMIAMANRGLQTDSAYQRIQGKNPDGTPNPSLENLVDVVNLIDYMLINFYGGNNDWDHHNWVAMRNRVTNDRGFIFLCWDMERILESRSTNRLSANNPNCPSNVFNQMRQNESFRQLFIKRAHLHLFNDGALTPTSAKNRWLMRTAQIEKALNGEVARWGNYRRDVHRWTSSPYDLYTKETHWLPQQNYILNTYFPDRTTVFINQLKAVGLLPNILPPLILVNGAPTEDSHANNGDIVEMTVPTGIIYYTTNGTDPVDFTQASGALTDDAIVFNENIEINQSVHIMARTFVNGMWSNVSEQVLLVDGAVFIRNTAQTKGTTLGQNYPNPFTRTTYIDYSIAKNAHVELAIFNLTGQRVATIVNGEQMAGSRRVEWTRDSSIKGGVYLYRLSTRGDNGVDVITRKMVVFD